MLCNYETTRIEILKEYVQILNNRLAELRPSEFGCTNQFVYGFEAAIEVLEEEANENQ